MAAILGISIGTTGSAACLVIGGMVRAVGREEIFSRRKADNSFPLASIDHCLRSAGITGNDLDYVAVADKPFLRLDRELTAHIESWPRGFRSFMKSHEEVLAKLLISSRLRKAFGAKKPIIFCHPHEAIAAFARWQTRMNECAILVVDDGRLPSAASVFSSAGREMKIELSLASPHSPWCFKQAFSDYLGLTPPITDSRHDDQYSDKLEKFLKLNSEGSVSLSQEFFDLSGDQAKLRINKAEKALGFRIQNSTPGLARAVDLHYERAITHLAGSVASRLRCRELLLAGVGISGLHRAPEIGEGHETRLTVIHGMASAQSSAGAAFFAQSNLLKLELENEGVRRDESRADAEIEGYLKRSGIGHETCTESQLAEKIGASLRQGETIAWMQGEADFFSARNQLLIGAAGSPKWESLQKKRALPPLPANLEISPRLNSILSNLEKSGLRQPLDFAGMEAKLEPSPARPQDAYRFFREYEIDCLVLGNCVIARGKSA